MAGKDGSLAERMRAVAEDAAALVEDDIALLKGFETPKDAAGVERRAKALGVILICARRVTDLSVATAKAARAAAKPGGDSGPEGDDPEDDGFDDDAERAYLKRTFDRYDALAAAGRPDRRLGTWRSAEADATPAAAAPGSPE